MTIISSLEGGKRVKSIKKKKSHPKEGFSTSNNFCTIFQEG
jgi:hypothetical protein